jgi:glycosyltransferase 2 family protein
LPLHPIGCYSEPQETERRLSQPSFRTTISKPFFWVKLVLFAMVLGGLGLQIRANWEKLPELSAPHPGWFIFSWGTGVLAMLLVPVILREILDAHGHQVSWQSSVGLYFVPLQGKYIPGKVWSMVWAMSAYRGVGVSWPTALSCLVVLTLLNLISALLVSVSLGSTVHNFPWYSEIVAFSLLILLEPRVFRFGVNLALRVPGKDPVHNTLSLKRISKLLSLNLVYWLLFGVGYWALSRSLFPDIVFSTEHLIAAQSGAFLIALLAFFAPAGLGVREGILAGLLAPVAGIGPAIVLAGAQRLWQISLELPCAGAGLYFLKKLGPLSVESEGESQCE